MTFKSLNVAISVAGSVVVLVALFICITFANARADAKREVQNGQAMEACTTLDEPAAVTSCIVSIASQP